MAEKDLIGFLGSDDLNLFQSTIQQSNPYNIGAQSLMQWQPNYSVMSPISQGATAFGRAFLSGIMQSYAREQAADQVARVVSVLPQLQSNPLGLMTPEGVDSGAFNTLRGSAVLDKYKRDALLGDERQKTVGDLLKTILGEGVKTGMVSPGDALAAAATGDYSGVLGSGTQADMSKNPNSPQYKLDKDLQDLRLNFLEKIAARPETKEYSNASNIFNTMQKSLDEPTRAADLAFVYGLPKMLDPSVVKEGEQRMLLASIPGLENFQKEIEAVFNSKGKLSKPAREAILKVGQFKLNAVGQQYNAALAPYKSQVGLSGLQLSDVLPFPEFSDVDVTTIPGFGGSEVIKAPDGNTYVFTD